MIVLCSLINQSVFLCMCNFVISNESVSTFLQYVPLNIVLFYPLRSGLRDNIADETPDGPRGEDRKVESRSHERDIRLAQLTFNSNFVRWRLQRKDATAVPQ